MDVDPVPATPAPDETPVEVSTPPPSATPDPLTDDERHALAEYAARHSAVCDSRDCFTRAELRRLDFWRWCRHRHDDAADPAIEAPPD